MIETDEELMDDFAESVSYVGEVADWRKEPLTKESKDEQEGEAVEYRPQKQQSPAEKRVDFAAIEKALDADAVKTDLALRVPIRKVLDDLIGLIKNQNKAGGITQSFVQSLSLTTGPEAQKILGDYLLGIRRKGRDLAIGELPQKIREKVNVKRFDLELPECAYCKKAIFHLPGQHDQCDHSPT